MSEPTKGIVLPAGETGSTFFHRVLVDAARAFPTVLSGARFPEDPSRFKRDYARALVRFEAARVAAPERVDVARHMLGSLLGGLGYTDGAATRPLAEHLASAKERPMVLDTIRGSGRAGLVPSVDFQRQGYARRSVVALAEDLHRQHHLTDAALGGLRSIIERAEAAGGSIDLTGMPFALVGAAAELAPTLMLLRAGATVLWIDRVAPADKLSKEELEGMAGKIVVPQGVGDVLADPAAVAQAIRAFAAEVEAPVHIGLFAYAPGKGRELRLGAGMDQIVRSLDPAIVASVSMFVSPTIPAEVQPEDEAWADRRTLEPPGWQRALERVRAIRGPGRTGAGGRPISHAIVGLQGPTYQAAQYVAKMASAEVYATQGVRLDGPARPVTVSANVAGIAATRSLVHPLFEAAFIGAPSFGVRIFEPATTRSLASLLVLHDLLEPTSPSSPAAPFPTPAARAAALASRQLHGGVYNLPWIFDDTIRAAAVIGLARRPKLALALAGMKKKG